MEAFDRLGKWLTFLMVLSFCSAAAQAVTVTLAVSPTTATSGQWSAGDLVQIIVTASTDGNDVQGFAMADFKSDVGWGITVDPSRLKIHDVLNLLGAQVDTESDASDADGWGDYLKAEDTWVYDNFTNFTGTVDMAPDCFQARALESNDPTNHGLGVQQPVDFLHLVFEIQPGLGAGQSEAVTFTGQVVAFNVPQEETTSNIFGTYAESDINSGSFYLTNIPEPASGVLLLAAVGCVLRVRRRRR